MKTKFRLAFFSHFFIDRNDTLMMLVFLDYCRYWIYAKIRVQHGVFPRDIGILSFIFIFYFTLYVFVNSVQPIVYIYLYIVNLFKNLFLLSENKESYYYYHY